MGIYTVWMWVGGGVMGGRKDKYVYRKGCTNMVVGGVGVYTVWVWVGESLVGGKLGMGRGRGVW